MHTPLSSEAEFLNVIGTTEVLRVFLLAIFTVTSTNGFSSPTPPPPPHLSKSGLKLVYNVSIVYGIGNLKSEV